MMCVSADRRWTRDGLGEVKGLPWSPNPDRAATEKPVFDEGEEKLAPILVPQIVQPQARERYVLKADIQKHGETDGCPGCIALAIHGSTTSRHNQECRERIGELMQRDAEG